ncbi:MAG: hypothetical protein WAN44_02595 [Propionibacteriaceae bacterium]
MRRLYVPAVRRRPCGPDRLEYFPLRTVIDNLVTEWLAGHARNDYLHCQSWP